MQDFYRSFNRDCELVSQLPKMKKDSTNTGEFFTCIRTVSVLLRKIFFFT